MAVIRHKEAIHSGHFMISDFEADAEDEEFVETTAEEGQNNLKQSLIETEDDISDIPNPEPDTEDTVPSKLFTDQTIDMSLNSLFRRMSIAYRKKLTSPKWNKFKGMKLRWRDKIRLNNVIWRCWHMQSKGRGKYGLCAFANPLEIDNHNKTEGSTLLEGKYWKRKMQMVTSEYTRWRMFYKNRGAMDDVNQIPWDNLFNSPFQMLEGSQDDASLANLIGEDDLFMDTFLNSFSGNLPGNFFNTSNSSSNALGAVKMPNPQVMYKNTTNSDFIQPDLFQLQPNLDNLFEFDPSWLAPRLSTIQEVLGMDDVQQQQEENPGLPGFSGGGGESLPPSELQEIIVPGPSNFNDLQVGGGNRSSSSSSQQISLPPPSTSQDLLPTQAGISCALPTAGPVPVILPHQQAPVQQSYQQQQQPQLLQDGQLPPPREDPISFAHMANAALNHGKRNSPKHRILSQRVEYIQQQQQQQLQQQQQQIDQQQRELQQLQPQMQLQNVVEVPKVTSNVRTSPYKIPTSPQGAAGSSSSAFANSSSNFLVEPKVKTRSKSGPTVSVSGFEELNALTTGAQPRRKRSHGYQQQQEQQQQQQQQQQQPDDLGQYSSMQASSELVNLLRSSSSSSSYRGGEPTKMPVLSTVVPPLPSGAIPQPKVTTGPRSPSGRIVYNLKPKTDSQEYSERRKVVHVSSEQSRRKNIKSGFDLLKSLVPSLSQNTNAKISKAALLHKGGDYLQQLMGDKEDLDRKIEAHRAKIATLNQQIEGLQNNLAVSSGSGSPSSGPESKLLMRELFNVHVRDCTLQNWKYWIFSRLMKPLLESFNGSVNTGSFEDLTRSSMSWLDQDCSLAHLHPSAMLSLKELAITTEIIDNPKKIAEEAVRAVTAGPAPKIERHPSSGSSVFVEEADSQMMVDDSSQDV